MLVPSRTASLAVCRQASSLTLVARLRPTGWLCCLSYPAQFARPLSGSAARVRASSTQRDGELKRQIISSANKIRFRYDIDNHKALTDAALDKAEKAIGYRFQNRQLLRLAFTHTSASAECNILLSWMGDAVLQLIVSEGLLSRYNSESIGDLAILRSAMVGRSSCFRYAKQLGLQNFLVVGNAIDCLQSEDSSARMFTLNIMAELFEAVLGAIYVDSNPARSHAWFAEQIGWPQSFKAAVKRFVKNSHFLIKNNR